MSRPFINYISAFAVVLLLGSPANAFWGFGSKTGADGGLDLVDGYDRNTVITVKGRVAAPPEPSSDPVTVQVVSGGERFTVVLGPRWYLQHDNLDWKSGDEITVRGSSAKGKDGRSYIFTQQFDTPGGGSIVLRNPSGRPAWAQGGRGGSHSGSGGAGMQRGTGGGQRGR